MKLFDYFMYTIYLFLVRLGRNEQNAKWSSFLYLSLYCSFFTLTMASICGLIIDNDISNLLLTIGLTPCGMFIGILTPVILSLRYYGFKGMLPIENKFNLLSNSKQKIVKRIVFIIIVTLPFFSFIFIRIFIAGQLKWW